MRKEFNITGSCNPQWHYMVNTEKRFKAVEALIDRGKYFTINRARQYGKTTTLIMICRNGILLCHLVSRDLTAVLSSRMKPLLRNSAR